MLDHNVDRRNFTRLAAAALGGIVVGASVVRAEDKKDAESLLLKEPHVCRGLNACKGIGAGKKNDCAGTGACATAKHHDCKGLNECKGQSGCGAKPGENACKGMGECAVPLSEKAWKTARKNYETAMTKAGKKFGEAPKPKKS